MPDRSVNQAMHLALNAYFWNQPDTGSGQYTRQLVYHLNRLVSDMDITLVYPRSPGAAPPEDVPPSVAVEEVPIRAGKLGKVLWEQVGFPRACGRLGVDVAHVPFWGSPLRSPAPVVVTIHDIITHIFPAYRRGPQMRLYNALVTASARGASHIITDSDASQEDIVAHLGMDPARMTTVYLAAGPDYSPESNMLLDMAVLQKYDLPDFYILYFGGYARHKNVNTLLLAYTYVADALGDEYPLVLAGRKPEKSSGSFLDYDDYIRRLNIEDKVRWIGYVDEADKPVLYRHASTFVFPSLYEGFGLPPLEAMASGAPVVTTTTSSLPEVVGDGAFAVDPEDERGMAGAIIATIVQDDLAAQLKQRGLAQAKQFTWEKTVAETVAVYSQVLEGRSREQID